MDGNKNSEIVIENKNKKNIQYICFSFIIVVLIICICWLTMRPCSIDRKMNKIVRMSEKYKKTSKEKYLKRQHEYYKDLAKKIKQKLIPILKHNVAPRKWSLCPNDDQCPEVDYLVKPELLADALERLKKSQIGTTNSEEGTHTLDKELINLCDESHTDRAIRNKNMLIGGKISVQSCNCSGKRPCKDIKIGKLCFERKKQVTEEELETELKYKSYIQHVKANLNSEKFSQEKTSEDNVMDSILNEGICEDNTIDCEKLTGTIMLGNVVYKVPILSKVTESFEKEIELDNIVSDKFELNSKIVLKFGDDETIEFANIDLDDASNTLLHVLIHEYAHVINDTIGHDYQWQTLFDNLLIIAAKQGWYEIKKDPDLRTYCDAKYIM